LIGMEHHATGAMTFRTVACLPALVGAWRERGGGLLHLTFNLFDGILNERDFAVADRIEDRKIRSINMVQLGRALTDPRLDPPIRALVVYNSNPGVIAPDQNRVFEGLRRDDLLTVVGDQFLTDTPHVVGPGVPRPQPPRFSRPGRARAEHGILPPPLPPHGPHRALSLRKR